MVLEQVVFLILAVVAVSAAIGMISMKDPVHSALLLVLTFFNLAGIYVLLGAEFLAVIQVLVYAGAIVVLFLFVMMLLQVRPGPSLNRFRFFQNRLGPVIALLFLLEVAAVVFASGFSLNGGKFLDSATAQAQRMQANIRYSVETAVPLVDAAGKAVGSNQGWGLKENVTVGHTALLGKELYSTYLLPFEVASLILLIAAIGAIVIARRNLEQDVEDGIRVGDAITLARPAIGSPQDEEVRKRGKVNDAGERRVILKK